MNDARRPLAVLAALALAAVGPRRAEAQVVPTAPETIALGEWQLAPSLELRTRAEYRRDAPNLGGSPDGVTAGPAVPDAYALGSRVRLGVRVDRGALRAQLTLQDARPWGDPPPTAAFHAQSAIFGPFEAFTEVRSPGARGSFVRVGRQAVTWGDGLLLGAADWSPVGRWLDAARGRLVVGDGEVEALAALLDAPHPLGQGYGDAAGPFRLGAQLYGVRAEWAFDPLLLVEAVALARFARSGGATAATGRFEAARSDGETYTLSVRVHGAGGPLAYAAEGAAQLGRATALGPRAVDRRAFAASATASYAFERLPWLPALRADFAYASGDEQGATYNQFDPIAPDVHTRFGAMDLVGLSNVLAVGGRVTATPAAPLTASLEYRWARLSRAAGEWLDGYVTVVGTGAPGGPTDLGHEVDATATFLPFGALALHGGYGLALLGQGARAVTSARGRGAAELAQAAWLQLTVRVP